MVDAWPASLPQRFLVDGYSEGLGNGLLEYQPDTGVAITRLRSSANARPLAGTFEMTSAQLADLRTFCDTTLLGGSLPFEFPDPLTGTTLLVKFNKEGVPRWSALGGDHYSVAVSLWILP